ncbi:hypothetical protein [Fluviicola taffensis]|uniref:hypothetical protein n=1 Tax=Fluviicola taffensis TaxID=191579 RepID=UPI0031381084
MSRQLFLEIKTFSIRYRGKRDLLLLNEVGRRLFGLTEKKITNKLLLNGFKTFVENSFNTAKSSPEEDFVSNLYKTKKYRFDLLEVDVKNSCVYGIFVGGNTGEEGNFNKRAGKKYVKTPLGPEDFTDSPFFFMIHFPVNSDTGVVMIQKYNDKSLNSEFQALIRQFFHLEGFNLTYKIFMSDKQKAILKKGSFVDKITIVQNKANKKLNEKLLFLADDKQYKIKIEISEIDVPIVDFAKSIVRKKEHDIEEYLSEFPDLVEFGIDADKSTIKAHVTGENAQGNPRFKDMGSYLEKMIPKIELNAVNKIKIENGKYNYQALYEDFIQVLDNDIIKTLEGEEE